ncbi:MAG TPA: M48 family metalloprotease [Vicinamibacterales bacterium]
MKNIALVFALVGLVALPGTASAQGIGGMLGKAKKTADKSADAKEKAEGLKISEKDERRIGEKISAALIDRFGVYQDKEVTKYVSLVGNVLAQASTRPNLQWEFIVLDTDGVNAYAAPGGLVHITRGALGLIKNEAELAGVLGHEITHVTAKHTIKTIETQNRNDLLAEAGKSKTGEIGDAVIGGLSDMGYKLILEGRFSRSDEMESDKVGTTLASKVGYAPSGMAAVLQKISDRNKNQAEPNGWFASHPEIKDRISAMQKQIKDDKLNGTALVAARYTKAITFDVKPAAEIATIAGGAKGLAGDGGTAKKDDKAAKPEEKPAEPAKKSGGLGKFLSKGSQAQNEGTVASAGTRGGVPDRDAVGGSNKSKVRITLTPAEIDTFKKGIA